MFTIMSRTANQSQYTRRYHPRHTLARYIITQIESLALRPQDIIKAMDYPLKHTMPACDRLRHVLSNKYLGLDNSYIDKYFTADAFLASLFTVLAIPYQPFAEDIAQIKYDLAHYPNTLPKYSLRADVDFILTKGIDWMSRGAISRFAHVDLPNGFGAMTEVERESVIQQRICQHYQQYEGNLPYEGMINSYQLIAERSDHVIERKAYGLPKSSHA